MNPTLIPYLEAKNLVGDKADEIDVFCDFWTDFYKDDGFFYLYEETANLSNLNLEFVFYCSVPNFAGLIFLKDLNAENIYTESNDQGANLIVLGDVYAKKAVIGGQEVYISGSLTIEDFFMGSYGHGNLIIKKDFICPMIIIDDYDIKVKGNLSGKVYGNDKYGNEEDAVFLEKENRYSERIPIEHLKLCFDDSFFNEYTIDFYEVSKSLRGAT